jgi:hypothetical protein
MFKNAQTASTLRPTGIPLPEVATYDPNEDEPAVLNGDRLPDGSPRWTEEHNTGASQVIGYAQLLDDAPVVPFRQPEPPKHGGMLVKVRDGNLYVDGQLADPDEFITGMRMAIKLT